MRVDSTPYRNGGTGVFGQRRDERIDQRSASVRAWKGSVWLGVVVVLGSCGRRSLGSLLRARVVAVAVAGAVLLAGLSMRVFVGGRGVDDM
jgi:hypothetical protein